MANENQFVDAAIVQQLEYYFDNCNLSHDKFLQEKMQLDEGWISIETLMTFNRLVKITNNQEAIAKAVKEANSEIISISDDGKKIRRKIENPPPSNYLEFWQKLKPMMVYMGGFAPDTTLDQIMEFAKKYGQVQNVYMRRSKPDRLFEGSVFITYKSQEEAETAQKSNDKFGETELTKMMHVDYRLYRIKEKKEKRAAKKIAKVAQKTEEMTEEMKAKDQVRFVKGLVLTVEGVAKDATVAEVEEFFRRYGNVADVIHEDGATSAKIRFNGKKNGANTAWDCAVAAGSEGKVLFKEMELSGKVLEGEEEEEYWSIFNAYKQKQKKHRRDRGRGRGGRRGRSQRRGGFRIKRKRAVGLDEDAPRAKRIVFPDDDDE